MRRRNPRLPVVCFDGIGRSERKNELSRLACFEQCKARNDSSCGAAAHDTSGCATAVAPPIAAHDVKLA